MKFLLLLSSIFFYHNVLAQKQGQPLIDSLVTEIPKLKDDSNKVKLLSRISQIYYSVNPMKSFPYAEQGLQLAEKIKWEKGIANLHNNLGLFISDTGNNALSRIHFEQSYTINKKLDAKFHLINNLNNIGRSYVHESNFSKATEYYFKALAIAEEIKSKEQISLVGTNLTASFLAQKNYPRALEYAEMTLKNAELAKATNNIGKALLQIGVIKMDTKDTASAKIYMERALKIYEDMGNKPQIAAVLTSIASLEYPDYKKAIEIMLKVEEITKDAGGLSLNSIGNAANLGSAYYSLALESESPEKDSYLQKSESYLLRAKALSEQAETAEYTATISLSLAKLEEEKGNYKTALGYYKTFHVTGDSLFSQEKKNEIAGFETKYNIALKDNEIALNELKLSDQKKTQVGLIAGLLLFGIIGGLLYWQSRSRKKTNTTLMVLNNQLDEANKVKARFFGILSHDLRSPVTNLIHFLHLQKNDPDLLDEKQRAHHQQKISQSAENLLNTMEFMLLWSKEQMESFKPRIEHVAIQDLFDYIQKSFEQTERITIKYSTAPGMSVLADENYLRVIMQNLTANAIVALKTTPDAIIEWNAKQDGDKTILSITDNGPGISGDQAKALFEDNIVANAKSGFGLHLIKDLAKAIRYNISVQSQPGMGTTFTLSAVAA
jgi:signal transduction histidine kinase